MVTTDTATGLRLTKTLEGYMVNTVSGWQHNDGQWFPKPGEYVGYIKKVGRKWHGTPAESNDAYEYRSLREAVSALAWRHDKRMEK